MQKMLVFLLVAICCDGYAQDSLAKKLYELVNAYASLGRFNGSVLVAQRDKILLQKGYGWQNVNEHVLNDPDTKFQIASVTKQFTAAVILKLASLKRISLNDTLGSFYAGFPYGDRITITQLLTHTSGLHSFTETDSSFAETDEKRMVPYIRSLHPDFAPGSGWHYSNSGYVMLGYIIQKVTGMSYWQAIHRYIFDPLHMSSSGFDFIHLKDDMKAVGYDQLKDSISRSAVITDSTVPFAAGAIYSTVKDMYKWHRGLRQYSVVDKEWMEKAYAPYAGHNYGYGWQIDSVFGKKMVSHSGGISGFGSNFARIPEDDICIVLLSNRSGSTFDVMNITRKLLAVFYNQPYTLPVKRVPVALKDDVFKKYTGTYEIVDMHLAVEVSVQNGVLIVQPYRDGHPGPTSVMLAIDDKHFYDKADEETEALFNIDGAGNVKGIQIIQVQGARYAKKIK